MYKIEKGDKIMKLFAIFGQDCIYQGLHGMIETEICEAESEEEALAYAKELSYNVIESYSCIQEDLETKWQDACDFDDVEDLESEEAQELWNNVITEDLDYGCYELDKEKLPTLDERELEEMLYNDFEDFIMKYQK